MKKARELFDEMKDDEKEHYLKLAKKEKLAYEIKKREYNSKHKKIRTPSSYNLFMSELKGTAPEKYSEKGFFEYAYRKWKQLDSTKKNKYEIEAKKLKDEADKEYQEKKSLEKSAPKKALSAYNLFIRDRLPELKKKHPKMEQTEFFGIIAEEYAKLSSTEMTKLQKRANQEKQRYEKQKSEYDIEMSEMHVTQLEKKEDKKEKEREARSKTRTNKKNVINNKSRSKSKPKNTDTESNEESEDDDHNEVKRGKGAKSKVAKGKKSKMEDSEEKGDKSKRGQSKKGKNTAK